MSNVWGIHMPEPLGIDAVENGYVAIGWPDLGNIYEIAGNREAYKTAVAKTYPDIKQGAVPVTAGVLFRYIRIIYQTPIATRQLCH